MSEANYLIRDPLTRFLGRYKAFIARKNAVYWRQFWKPLKYGQNLNSIGTYRYFLSSFKELLFWVTFISTAVTVFKGLFGALGYMFHSPVDFGDDSLWLLAKTWALALAVAFVIVPMAIILRFCLRKRRVTFTMSLCFFFRMTSLLIFLYCFFTAVMLTIGAVAALAFGGHADASSPPILIYRCGFIICFAIYMLSITYFFFVVPQRVLSGWIGISYLKSFSILIACSSILFVYEYLLVKILSSALM